MVREKRQGPARNMEVVRGSLEEGGRGRLSWDLKSRGGV